MREWVQQVLNNKEVALLKSVAQVLLPGDDTSPAAGDVSELDEFLRRASLALGTEGEDLRGGLAILEAELGPAGEPHWAGLKSFAQRHPLPFELVGAVVAGAYFMAPEVLTSIGYPQGPRRAPRNDLIVDEIETGVLEPMMAREPTFRQVPR